jgi:hypothetical protein
MCSTLPASCGFQRQGTSSHTNGSEGGSWAYRELTAQRSRTRAPSREQDYLRRGRDSTPPRSAGPWRSVNATRHARRKCRTSEPHVPVLARYATDGARRACPLDGIEGPPATSPSRSRPRVPSTWTRLSESKWRGGPTRGHRRSRGRPARLMEPQAYPRPPTLNDDVADGVPSTTSCSFK